MEYNKMALDCFKAIALDEMANHYTPEYDEPQYTSTVAEFCDFVYHEGVNREQIAVGPRMRALYVPKALRYQGKKVLVEHVKMAVYLALMDWIMESNDCGFLADWENGQGALIEQWAAAQEVA